MFEFINKASTTDVIASLALILSIINFVWTIIRDIRRPKLKISIHLMSTHSTGEVGYTNFIQIRAVNFGPMANRVGLPHAKMSRLAAFFRPTKSPYGFIVPEYNHPGTTPQPKRSNLIEIGDEISFAMPYKEGCFLAEPNLSKVGVSDAFGRAHYAPRKQLSVLKNRYAEDFEQKRA